VAKKRGKQKNGYGKKRFGSRGFGKPDKRGKCRKLTYFYTTEQWEAARRSPEFMAWCKAQQPPPAKKIRIRIKARPVMHLAQGQVQPKIPELWTKAEKQVLRK
jgi:hypothetical protein